jgi:hypothetical protein
MCTAPVQLSQTGARGVACLAGRCCCGCCSAVGASACELFTTALQGGRQDGVAVLREDVMLQRMPHMRAQAGKSAPEVGPQLPRCLMTTPDRVSLSFRQQALDHQLLSLWCHPLS